MTPRYLPGGHGLTWREMTTMPHMHVRIRHTCACCGRKLDPERPPGFNLCPVCRRREVSWLNHGRHVSEGRRKDKSA